MVKKKIQAVCVIDFTTPTLWFHSKLICTFYSCFLLNLCVAKAWDTPHNFHSRSRVWKDGIHTNRLLSADLFLWITDLHDWWGIAHYMICQTNSSQPNAPNSQPCLREWLFKPFTSSYVAGDSPSTWGVFIYNHVFKRKQTRMTNSSL